MKHKWKYKTPSLYGDLYECERCSEEYIVSPGNSSTCISRQVEECPVGLQIRLTAIRVVDDNNPKQADLVFKFGNRFQAYKFDVNMDNEEVAKGLRKLANNIEHDKELGK